MTDFTGPTTTCPNEDDDWGHLERMVMEITCGRAKADSLHIHSAEDSQLWDRLAVEIAEIHAKGHQVVFDNGA